jgi:Xaa-Pro aminopeptidase
MYEVTKQANIACINYVKDGVKGIDADKIARDYIKSNFDNYDVPHGTGHGVGLEIHEHPRINKIANYPLETGNVVTIEPGIYINKLGGVRIEDNVVITKTGCIVLTKKAPK